MRILVQEMPGRPDKAPHHEVWMLVPNTWNDYSYRTLYNLYHVSGDELTEIGGVKIMKLGQQEFELPLSEGELEDGLPSHCASLGGGLDFYVSLRKHVGEQATRTILQNLRDLATDPTLRPSFEPETAFKKSLIRYRKDHLSFYDDVSGILLSGGLPPEPKTWSLSYSAGEGIEPIDFHFGRVPNPKVLPFKPGVRPSPFSQTAQAPTTQPSRRTVVLVGANGVGKTSLLAKLARLAYTGVTERDPKSEDGRFVGEPAFPSIVAVAYSAFDTFKPPEIEGDDRAEVANQLASGSGRYAYCGMRDLASLVRNPDGPEQLLTSEQQANIFVDRLQRIRDLGRLPIFAEAMSPVLDEISVRRGVAPPREIDAEGRVDRVNAFLSEDPRQAYLNLSSGHKIVLHIIVSMTASLKMRGLALVDEPETHLHPPLLAALMTGLRIVLEKLESFAIVATHSPVVAQETLASQIIVMEGHGITRSPTIQTFGENVGALTREIFGLHTEATDYRRVLKEMAEQLGSLESVEGAIGEGLSGQAEAYLMFVLPEGEQ